jgi:uncharacterized membrane protein
MKILGWIIFGFFAVGVGLYPVLYFALDMSQGFLATKSEVVRQSQVWNFLFYQHIIFGGVALLTGWTQFSRKIRSKKIRFHRTLGKIYVGACLLSGCAGLYIAFYATGGIVSSLGFGGLALSWLFTTSKAYLSIRQKRINDHQDWMTRSYALTFAAVTLRLWLPLSQALDIEFISAYVVISWLCWVPNLLVAEWMVMKRRPAAARA